MDWTFTFVDFISARNTGEFKVNQRSPDIGAGPLPFVNYKLGKKANSPNDTLVSRPMQLGL